MSLPQINRTKQSMLLKAWCNLGAFNRHDGSEDGDINTLQRNHRPEVAFTEDNELSVPEMLRRVTIRRRLNGTVSRHEPLHRPRCQWRGDEYDITALKLHSRRHELPKTLWHRKTMMDCFTLNAPQKQIYDELWAQDQSNIDLAFADTRWMITPTDVEVLFALVQDIAGRAEAEYMQTMILGLPLRRDCDGAIVVAASPSPLIKWKNCLPTPRYWRKANRLRDDILDHLHIPGVSPKVDFDEDAVDEKQLHVEELHEQRVLEHVKWFNRNMSAEQVEAYAPQIKRYSLAKPKKTVSRIVRSSTRKAVRGGVQRGKSVRSGYDFAVAFQMFVETNGALFRMDLTEHVVDDGM